MNRITDEKSIATSKLKSKKSLASSQDRNPLLTSLGQRLRLERLKRKEHQAKFAARLGVSIPTLRKMESGDRTVQIGYWATALSILNRESDINLVLAPQEDLFAIYEKANKPTRQRAPRTPRPRG